jgi:Rgg/GadR/MutR family transcriptional activator
LFRFTTYYINEAVHANDFVLYPHKEVNKIRNFGEILKYIRKSKNMTQEYLCKDIMSRSNLSRFESGNYEISVSKFIYLLNRLSISFEEFLYIYNGYNINEAEQLYLDLVEAENSVNIRKIKEISAQAYSSLKMGNTDYELTFVTAQNVLYKNKQPTMLNFNDLQIYVQEHLVQADNWFMQDFRILNNFLAFFETDDVVYFVNRAISEFKKYNKIGLKNNISVHFLLNAGTILFNKGRLQQAREYFLYTKKQGLEQQKLLPVILSECYLSLIAIKMEKNSDDARLFFLTRIKLLESWGYNDLSEELSAHLAFESE